MTDLVVLLDVRARLNRDLARALGDQHSARFWEIYEEVREETDLVNFPETVERFGRECPDTGCVSEVSSVLYDFSFRECVYPDSLKAIQHVSSFATPVILSDGDQVCQGRYAQDPAHHDLPGADLEIEDIGEMLTLGPEQLLSPSSRKRGAVRAG